MMWKKGLSTITAAVFGAALAACSSDSAPLPEANYKTRGAFVAIDGYEREGEIRLIRTLDRLQLETDAFIFLTVYDTRPASFAEAEEQAKSHEIPIEWEIRIEPEAAVTDHPYQVVWFRTLNEEEEARIP